MLTRPLRTRWPTKPKSIPQHVRECCGGVGPKSTPQHGLACCNGGATNGLLLSPSCVRDAFTIARSRYHACKPVHQQPTLPMHPQPTLPVRQQPTLPIHIDNPLCPCTVDLALHAHAHAFSLLSVLHVCGPRMEAYLLARREGHCTRTLSRRVLPSMAERDAMEGGQRSSHTGQRSRRVLPSMAEHAAMEGAGAAHTLAN